MLACGCGSLKHPTMPPSAPILCEVDMPGPTPAAIAASHPPLPTAVVPSSGLQRPLEVIADANQRARYEPMDGAFAQSLLVLPYHPGGLYRIYTAPDRLTDLQLQPGERLLAVTGADTARWQIEESVSGAGPTARVHLLVKPLQAWLTTTMIITTSKRAYHLDVTSDPTTALIAVAWHYAEEEQRPRAAQAPTPVTPPVVANAAYSIRARRNPPPPWMPLAVCDNGEKTFIRFPTTLKTGEAPVFYVVAPSGARQLVNYHSREDYYIVDRLIEKAELRVGVDSRQVVRIERRQPSTP
jgi:type IV secretion system protein VirB9